MDTEDKQRIYKMIFYGQVTDAEKILSEDVSLSPCLLALIYALQNKTEQAEQTLHLSDQNCREALDCLACEEAGMILTSIKVGTTKALEQAIKITETYPDAAIAHYFVSRNALKRRKWDIALEHYRHLINLYPDNDGLLLDMAEVLFVLKKSSAALDHAKGATVSLRQILYRILIPLGNPMLRVTTLLAIFGMFAITGLNTYIFIGFVALMGIGFLASFKKDIVISSSILYLAVFGTIIWFFSRWVWHLQMGR